MIIGVISDTHGLLRPEATAALKGSHHILHAGDVGDSGIIEELRRNAPVTFIRGNIDIDTWGRTLPDTEVVELASKHFYMLHDIKTLDLDPRAAGFDVVISGHSHKPIIEWKNDLLYFNPGSAGPRRFNLPITVGRIRIERDQLQPEIIELSVQMNFNSGELISVLTLQPEISFDVRGQITLSCDLDMTSLTHRHHHHHHVANVSAALCE